MLPDDDEAVLTWRAILNDDLSVDWLKNVSKLSLHDGRQWFFNFDMPFVLARDCTSLLFDRVLALKAEAITGILLTGTPGIGKSWFIMYVIYRLARQKPVPTIILHSAKRDAAYCLRPDGTVAKITGPGGEDLADVSDLKSWYLFDADESKYECFPIPAFTIVAASPNEDHYKGFLKERNRATLWMPPWTLSDLRACRRLMCPDLEAAELKRRFERAGGVPRTVFGSDRNYEKFLTRQYDQIRRLSVKYIFSLFDLNFVNDESGCQLSHAIVKNELADNDNGDFEAVKLSFISKSVAADFFRAKVGQQGQGIYNMMAVALSKHIGVAGQVFESGFHFLIQLEGRVGLRCVAVIEGKELEHMELAADNIKYMTCGSPENKAMRRQSSSLSYYFVPNSSQHPFVDSILVTGGILWCIQLTVGGRRKGCSGRKLKDYLSHHFQNDPNVRFLFVVPCRKIFTMPVVKTRLYVAEFSMIARTAAASGRINPVRRFRNKRE